MQKITPCLWFDGRAEEAMNFYVSVFNNSKAGAITRYTEAGPGEPGSVLTATFQLDGQEFMALNGGPEFTFSEAISFVVECATQEEIDRMWSALSDGGEEGQCGWLKDRFGVSWQIVSPAWDEMLQDPDPAKSNRVMEAILQMGKPDLAALQRAYAGT